MAKKDEIKREIQIEKPSSPRRWIFALFLLFFAVIWLLSLLTYSQSDWPERGDWYDFEASNALGIVGSFLATITIYLFFGFFSSFIFPILLSIHSFYLFKSSLKAHYFKFYAPLLAFGWLIGNWIAWFQMQFFSDIEQYYTGFLSKKTIDLLWQWMNSLGTFLILLLLSLILIGLVFGKQIYNAIRWYLQKRHLKRNFEKKVQLTKDRKDNEIDSDSIDLSIVQPTPVKQTTSNQPSLLIISDESNREHIPANVPEIVAPKPVTIVRENIPNPIAKEIEYKLPSLDLFEKGETGIPDEPYEEQADKLKKTLKEFNVTADIYKIHPGPVVTRYDFVPGPGVKVSSFTSLSDDLARTMRATSVRVLAPVPGTEAVGIEIPNQKPRLVRIREVLESTEFQKDGLILPVALGLTTDGQPRVTDLAKLPHLLIAGATGSGKSVFINALLASLLLRKTPQEVRIALIDPKQVELSPYKVLVKHHLIKMMRADAVVNKPAEAVKLLHSCVLEMERRLEILTLVGVRDLQEYQSKHRAGDINAHEQLSYIVVVIDELADLMLASAKEVEDPIQRIAQKARAVGIHLVVATQRPSVNVITGVIKANLATRLAFQVASQIDSRTILEQGGAEKLLGKGDSLFGAPGAKKPERIHCGLITGKETHNLLNWIVSQPQAQLVELQPPKETSRKDDSDDSGEVDGYDSLFPEAARLLVRQQQGSVALIQRRFKVGYARAGRILDQLERTGIVGQFDGSKPREVLVKDLVSLEELLEKLGIND